MASPRALIFAVVAVALVFAEFSVIDAKVCGVDADCLTPNADAICVSGTCKYMCLSNFKNCDHKMDNGCEINIMTDEFNCGGCDRPCPAPYNAIATCEAGRCAISSGDGWRGPGF